MGNKQGFDNAYNKQFSLKTVLAIITSMGIISLFVGSGIYFWQRNKSEFHNWYKYTNDEIGISFRYPPYFGKAKTEILDSENKLTLSGQCVVISFEQESRLTLFAYTKDHKAFSPFDDALRSTTAAEDLCPEESQYKEDGDVCKILDLADTKAVFMNEFIQLECSPCLFTSIYLENRSKSIFEGLKIALSGLDAEKEIEEAYATYDVCGRNIDSNGNEIIETSYDYIQKAKEISEKITEKNNLDNKDLRILNDLDKILSTFRFIK